MGIVFRQSIKTTIISLAGTVLGAAFILLSPKFLAKDALGFSRNFIFEGAVMQFLVLLGVNSVIITFVPHYKPEAVQRKVLMALGFALPLIVCALFCIPYFLLKDWLIHHYQLKDQPLLHRYYALLPVLTLIWSYVSLLDSYLATQMKIALSAFAREVILRLGNFAILGLFAANVISFDGFMIGSVIIYTVPFIMMLAIALRTKGFGLSVNWRSIAPKDWRHYIHFAWYHLLHGVAFTLIGFLDVLMLAPLDKSGMSAVAIYTIAVFIASFVTIPYRAMAAAAQPVLNQAYIDKDMPRLNDFFHRSAINITVVGTAMFVLIACNLQNLIRLLPAGKGYEAVAPLALVLMIGRLADIFTGLNNELLSISSHYKFLFRISAVLLIIFIALNRILIPHYSFYGTAWSASLSLLFFNIAKYIFVYRKFRLQPFDGNTLRVFLSGGIAAIAGCLLPYAGNIFLDAAFRSMAILFAFGVAVLALKPSPDLQTYVSNVRRNKRLF